MTGFRPKRPKNHVTWSTCRYCGKRGYPTRRQARRAAQAHAGGGVLNEYECPQVPDGFDRVWHLGHLPDPVAAGRWARRTLGTPRARVEQALHQHRPGVWCPDCHGGQASTRLVTR